MDEKHTRGTSPAGAASSTGRDPTASPAHDSVTRYINRSIDMASLTGDIQKIVAEHIENSIPDDKKLMLELVSQVGELTGEVKQLRQQLDSKPYAVFGCPSGQMKDITAELAEIKQLLRQEPAPEPLVESELDPLFLGPREPLRTKPETPLTPPPQPDPAPPPPVEPPPQPVAAPVPQSAPAPDAAATPPEGGKPKKKRGALSILGNVLFYVALIGLVAGAFLAKSGSGGQPTVIAGYSAFTVLSSSMEDTYPKGSLIITRSVDANELKIGDDITYMASATSSITHRIIGITENYLGTGARGFETQGTMNENPDKEPVAAANVVGQVIFCSVLLGQAATFVSANWPILLFFVVVLSALIAFLRWNFKREDEPQPDSAPKKQRKH